MKLFVAVLLVAAATADRLENTYLPPNSAKTAGGSGNFLATPLNKVGAGSGFAGAGAAPSGAYGAPAGGVGVGSSGAYAAGGAVSSGPVANILKFNNENNGDGSYNYAFETDNHIQQQESGHLKNEDSLEAQGAFTFTAPDGQTFSIQYVADENGFQPQGAHIPTAPPVPEEILKALQQNAADEAAGIVDDGQYRPDPSEGIAGKKYGGSAAAAQSAGNGGYKY